MSDVSDKDLQLICGLLVCTANASFHYNATSDTHSVIERKRALCH